jgi:hypothetical protein
VPANRYTDLDQLPGAQSQMQTGCGGFVALSRRTAYFYTPVHGLKGALFDSDCA